MLVLAGGCVEREFIATSSPDGALLSMNGQEISRTPLAREPQWYGYYDATVRLDGYETKREVSDVVAPPWLWFPFDLVTELLPFTIRDEQRFHYELQPTPPEATDPPALISRGRQLQTRLESGQPRPTPATQPATTTSAAR